MGQEFQQLGGRLVVGDTMLNLMLNLRVVRPVGGKTAFPVDVRVIAATHQDLSARVARRARFGWWRSGTSSLDGVYCP